MLKLHLQANAECVEMSRKHQPRMAEGIIIPRIRLTAGAHPIANRSFEEFR